MDKNRRAVLQYAVSFVPGTEKFEQAFLMVG